MESLRKNIQQDIQAMKTTIALVKADSKRGRKEGRFHRLEMLCNYYRPKGLYPNRTRLNRVYVKMINYLDNEEK